MSSDYKRYDTPYEWCFRASMVCLLAQAGASMLEAPSWLVWGFFLGWVLCFVGMIFFTKRRRRAFDAHMDAQMARMEELHREERLALAQAQAALRKAFDIPEDS